MNDAQLFVIFFSVLSFGWLGFLAARAWDTEYKVWHFPVLLFFFLGSIYMFIGMVVHLITLVGRNF